MGKMMRVNGVVLAVCGATGWACSTPDTTAELEVTLAPSTETGVQTVKVNITAVNADGTIGAGSVEVQSSAGSLTTPVMLTLDAFGLAQTTLTSVVAEDMCSTSIRVVATWTPTAGGQVTGEKDLKVLTPGYDAGSVTENVLSPIDPVCSTDAGLMTFYPDAGPLIANDVPSDCANGFELNNAKNQGVYTVSSKTSAGTRAITLDVDLATYLAPDRVRITGVDSCGQSFLLLSSCQLQTASVGDPTGGNSRPPDDTIRQFRLNVPAGAKQLSFDFSGVTSPMYIQVLGLCDFNIVTYANAVRWAPVP